MDHTLKFQHITFTEKGCTKSEITIDPWDAAMVEAVRADMEGDPTFHVEVRDCTPVEIEGFIAGGGVEDALDADAEFDRGWDDYSMARDMA